MNRRLVIISVILLSLLWSVFGLVSLGASQPAHIDPATGIPEFYYAEGLKKDTAISTALIAVKFKPETKAEDRAALINSRKELEPYDGSRELLADPSLYLAAVKSGNNAGTVKALIGQLGSDAAVDYASPAYGPPGAEAMLTDEMIVRFKDTVSEEEAAGINREAGVELVEKNQWGEQVLRVTDPRGANALSLANAYYESGATEYAQPNFLRLVRLDATPNDTDFANQWGLHNTGQWGGTADADIDAPEAWDLNKGSTSIKIAVLDVGVDLTHEDLTSKLVTGWDSVDGDFNPQPQTWDYHGTASAGIAAAATNNSRGVAGVDWYAKIMPVRIGYTISPTNPTVVTSDAQLSNSIRWAADNGAKVISNSWSMGGPSDTVTSAIQYAKGLGATLLFSSGNGNAGVNFPATRPEVIAVGATNLCDERKTPVNSNCNYGYSSWGSNYGPELDVMAPGVAIETTDNMGANGGVSGNYSLFSGTSASTPMVAGVAALLLAQDSSRTPDQIQYLLAANSEDKGASGRDDSYGFGRINAYLALKSDINYLMPWYDEVTAGMFNWVMVANPNTNTTRANASVTFGSTLSGLKGVYSFDPGRNVTPRYPGQMGGPVKASSADGATRLLFSQRALYNDNFNETMGVPESKLETDYYLSWYDDHASSPPMSTYILIANRGASTANVEVYVQGVLRGTYQVAPDQVVAPSYYGLMGGPVRVRSTNGQKLMVSERTLYNGGFTEVMGVPASNLSTEYSFTWYDSKTANGWGGDWMLIGNLGSGTAHVEVYIQNMAIPAYSYDIPAGGVTAPTFPDTMAGPVKVKSTTGQQLIVSQRTLYKGHFEEVQGTPAAGFSSDAWFTWYDTINMNTWIMLSNLNTLFTTTADIYVGGQKKNAAPISVGPASTAALYYSGTLDGPVEVRVTFGPSLLVSQRTLYKNSFNELVGTTLSD